MTESPQDEDLAVLACEIGARPRGAPTVFDVLPAVRSVTRFPSSLRVDFDPARAETVAGYVAAEHLCCRDIRWEVERGAALLRLVITATPAQLDVLEQLYQER